jgi:hypothetical protein
LLPERSLTWLAQRLYHREGGVMEEIDRLAELSSRRKRGHVLTLPADVNEPRSCQQRRGGLYGLTISTDDVIVPGSDGWFSIRF